MNLRRLTCMIATVMTLAVGSSLAGVGTAGAVPDTGSAGGGSSLLGEASPQGVVVNVVNMSNHALRWVGGTDPVNTPKPILVPGDTDRIVYKGFNILAKPIWQVDGTSNNLYPKFQVPGIGPNISWCLDSDDHRLYMNCDIGSGWEPDAHLYFLDRPGS